MGSTAKRNKKKFFLKLVLGLLVSGAATGGVFIYGILPGKVAQAIVDKAKIHKALVQSPKNYGLKFENVSFSTDDGITLSGWWLPVPKDKKTLGTILLSHGVFKNREQVLDRAELLVKSGYQVLLFDQRGCGLSGESPTSGGVLEAEDYLAGAKWLDSEKRVRKPLVFFGFSMGAMSSLRAAARSSAVDGVIADSPLANLKCYVARRTSGGKFSSLPGFLGRCLKAYDQKTGLSLTVEEMDLIPVVQKIKIPVLYFTGERDDLALPEEVRKLFENTQTRHRGLVYITDAGHEETFEKSPFQYARSVIEFLKGLSPVAAKSEPNLKRGKATRHTQ